MSKNITVHAQINTSAAGIAGGAIITGAAVSVLSAKYINKVVTGRPMFPTIDKIRKQLKK